MSSVKKMDSVLSALEVLHVLESDLRFLKNLKWDHLRKGLSDIQRHMKSIIQYFKDHNLSSMLIIDFEDTEKTILKSSWLLDDSSQLTFTFRFLIWRLILKIAEKFELRFNFYNITENKSDAS